MSSITEGLPLAYLDVLAVALADLMHQDQELRGRFGGLTLGGTVNCTPGSTTFNGTGTGWLTDATDSLSPGDQLVAGPQLVKVMSVSSDILLEIEAPLPPATEPGHVAGLIDATIHKAASGHRVSFPHLPIRPAVPYWTVAPGLNQPPYVAGVGRRLSNPTLQWTGVYLEGADANLLEHDQPSWAALSALAERIVLQDEKTQTLQVPRFDTTVLVQGQPEDKSTRLVRQLFNQTPEMFPVGLPDTDKFITAAAMVFNFEGLDPGTLRPRRW